MCVVKTTYGQSRAQVDSLKSVLDEDAGYAEQIERYLGLASLYRIMRTDSLFVGFDYIDKAHSLIDASGLEDKRAQVYRQAGLLYHKMGDLDNAASCYDSSHLVSKDSSHYYLTSIDLAFVQADRGLLDLAIDLGIRAKNFFQNQADLLNLSRAYAVLGWVYMRADQADNAIVNLKRALRQTDELSPAERASHLGNIAVLAKSQGRLDSAEKYFQRSIQNSAEVPDLMMIGKANLADVALDKGQLDRSLALYQEVLNSPSYDWSNEHHCMLAMGYAEVLHIAGQSDKALSILERLTTVVSISQDLARLADFHELNANVFSSIGDFEKAFSHQQEYSTLKDSLSRVEHHLRFEDIAKKYESAEKEKRIQELNTSNELNVLKYEHATQRNLTLGAALLFVMLLTFFLWRQRNRIRLQHSMISQTLADREILLKEIHHRMKNNLQIVSGLLDFQSRDVRDEAVLDTLRIGRSRITTMGLIHKELYLRDQPEGVNAKSYLEKLVKALEIAYKPPQLQVRVETDIEDIWIDGDTMTPLGLLVNELICNAFKYSFLPDQLGVIKLELSEKDDTLHLRVSDNGRGMESSSWVDAGGFGSELCRALARRLDADMVYNSDDGLSISLQIRAYKTLSSSNETSET